MEINQILRSKKALRDFLGKCYPITDWIGDVHGLIRCPFHDDNRPSAKIFRDEDYPRVWCYAEGKQYSTVDYLTLVLGVDPKEFLLGKISENPKALDVLADSFVMETKRSQGFPIKEILEDNLKSIDSVSLSATLFKMYRLENREED